MIFQRIELQWHQYNRSHRRRPCHSINLSCILSVLSYFILVGCKDVDYCGHTIFCVLVTSTNIQYTGTIPQRQNNIVSKN